MLSFFKGCFIGSVMKSRVKKFTVLYYSVLNFCSLVLVIGLNFLIFPLAVCYFQVYVVSEKY